MTADSMTPEQTAALDHARALAAAGVPVFVAHPDDSPTGYRLPKSWQTTRANPRYVDAWRPGLALCAVMGHGLDLVDFDPRNGADASALNGTMPVRYGIASTPSGGVHAFVASLGVRSRDNVLPGIDIKAGDAEGKGRGFAFIAPTVRPSKVTGEPVAYRWLVPPDLAKLAAADGDRSGEQLAAMVAQARAGSRAPAGAATEGPPAPSYADLGEGERVRIDAYVASAVDGITAELRASADWDESATDDRGRGWEKLQADAALRLGQLARAEWNNLDLADAEAAFVAAAPVDGSWSSDDVELKWRQQSGRLEPAPAPDLRSIPERDAEGWAALGVSPTPVAAAPSPGSPAPAAAARGPQLDDARLSEWLAATVLRGRYLWARPLGGWLRWDGRRWKPATDKAVDEVTRQTFVALLGSEARAGADSDRLKKLTGLLSAGKIRAVVGLAGGILEADAEDFDRRPDLLNVGNGVVDLATGQLAPHDPRLLFTKVTRVNYVPGARHEDWDAALRALPVDVAGWLQVRLGQAATGHMTPDDVLPVLQGGGANGKTTLTAAVRAALGDHAVVVPDRVLLANPSDHPTELMTLRGARLAMIEETPEARHLNVKRLKDVVGTPTMTARLIRKDNVSWTASHSLVLTSNYRPRVDEADHGTWRRLALVRFPFTFAGASCDPGLRERLRDGEAGQLEAVLAWIVEGARAWYANRKVMPPAPALVRGDTDEWRAEADAVLAYIRECLMFDPAASVLTSELLMHFNQWLAGRGGRAWADQTFAARFGSHSEVEPHGVRKTRVRDLSGLVRKNYLPGDIGTRPSVWTGVRWLTSADDVSAGHSGVDKGGQGSSGDPLVKPFTRVNRDPLSTLGQVDGAAQAILDGIDREAR